MQIYKTNPSNFVSTRSTATNPSNFVLTRSTATFNPSNRSSLAVYYRISQPPTDEKIHELISVHERTRITPLSIPDLSGKVALLRSTRRVPVDGALSATSSSVERVLFQLQTLQTLIEELTSKMDRFRNDLPRLTRSQEIPATEPTPPPVSQLTCPATTSCVP